jgi:hypothetical protein
MSVTGEIELAKGSIDLFQSAVDDLINRYGRGVRPAWVNRWYIKVTQQRSNTLRGYANQKNLV